MENLLGYLIFGVGWPVLIIGSIWMWRRAVQLPDSVRHFLNIALAAFYTLGYVCTAYWQGMSWIFGVLPAFAVFLILFVAALREVNVATRSSRSGHGGGVHA
jgi:hypothetical protein